jgi:uncharacterized protein YfiM (DUF2279 family)
MAQFRNSVLACCLLAGGVLVAPAEAQADPGAEAKVSTSRWVGLGSVIAWGFLQWDYGDRSLHARSEGWFGADTPEGGADKLGHFYTAYIMSRAFGGLYEHWGLEKPRASRDGFLTALLLTTAIEVGDGFSPYGASWEDMVMNAGGAWLGHALRQHPVWRERLDVRVEYRFNGDAGDISTDYESARYLVVLKGAGFEGLRATPLRWLELHAGYYARGFSDPLREDRRTVYVGLGLNFSEVMRHFRQDRAAKFFQFYQPPGTTLRAEHDLD